MHVENNCTQDLGAGVPTTERFREQAPVLNQQSLQLFLLSFPVFFEAASALSNIHNNMLHLDSKHTTIGGVNKNGPLRLLGSGTTGRSGLV